MRDRSVSRCAIAANSSGKAWSFSVAVKSAPAVHRVVSVHGLQPKDVEYALYERDDELPWRRAGWSVRSSDRSDVGGKRSGRDVAGRESADEQLSAACREHRPIFDVVAPGHQ